MEERNSIVVEEYLLLMKTLESESTPTKASVLAVKLKSSPSTVHATLSRMQRDKLVTINKKKEIHLTEEGRERADKIGRRHRLLEYFLYDTLKIPWYEVHKHAHILEHAITPLVEEKLNEFLNFPGYCPHGTPIIGNDAKLPENLIILSKADSGMEIEVVVIEEILEESLELMEHLHEKKIMPGEKHKVLEKLDVTKTIILETEDSQISLPFDIADKIGVIPVS